MSEAALGAESPSSSSSSSTQSAPEGGAESPSDGGSTGERGALNAEPRRPLSPHERRERLLSRLRERIQADGAGPGGSGGGGSGGAEAAPDSALSEAGRESGAAADGDREAPKPAESREERETKDLELRLSRVSRQLREAQTEALEAKETVAKYRALEAKIARAKGDAYAAIEMMPELYGFDFGQLADMVVQNEGRFRQEQKYAQLPPELREEVELARKERQERAEKAKKDEAYQQEVARFTTYQKSAETFLEANKDDYPLSHAIGWAPGQIARTALERGTRDARPLLDELEKDLRDQLVGAFGNAQIVRALVGHDKTLADKVRGALESNGSTNGSTKPYKSPAAASFRSGTEQPAREGPASISNGVASSDTADYQTRRDLRRQRVMEEAKRFFHGR